MTILDRDLVDFRFSIVNCQHNDRASVQAVNCQLRAGTQGPGPYQLLTVNCQLSTLYRLRQQKAPRHR